MSTKLAADQLRAIIERVESALDERREANELIREIYAEAKGNGFDTRTLRRVVSLRQKDPAEREEAEAMLDLYLHALGLGHGEAPEPVPKKSKPAKRPARPAVSPRRPQKPAVGFRRVGEEEW